MTKTNESFFYGLFLGALVVVLFALPVIFNNDGVSQTKYDQLHYQYKLGQLYWQEDGQELREERRKNLDLELELLEEKIK